MKRKVLLTMLCLATAVSIVACGKGNTTEQQEVIATEQTAETETVEEQAEQESETALEQENKVNDTEELLEENKVYDDVNPEDTDPKATNIDYDTATALAQQERKELDAKYGSEMKWAEYAKSQGADNTLGWCWIYYTGQGAGDQESYAVYMKEDSPRYGEVFHLGDYLPGGDFFVGANNEEHGIADDREFQRMYDNGELSGITIDENGDIIVN